MISKRNPFLPPLPDDRISLCVYADETGFRYWNRSSDPMPIKTINMNGLQKWEETDDYIIYLDKDAVMTTVANYVTGTYDLFKERKVDIDGSMELLRANDIEWTAEDDSKLILDINKAQLERIANTPTTMEEEDFTPQTFTTRAVPTTYECCFRIDKSSGEIYIGEGYENFGRNVTGAQGSWIKTQSFNDGEITVISNPSDNIGRFNYVVPLGEAYSYSYKYSAEGYKVVRVLGSTLFVDSEYDAGYRKIEAIISADKNISDDYRICWGYTVNRVDETVVKMKDIQITKTSTPKPFVKSIMPSGKLAFVTGANETTHTFLNKGDGVVTFENGYFSLKGDKVEQLLVYKGLLTQAEKDAELAKNIRLK